MGEKKGAAVMNRWVCLVIGLTVCLTLTSCAADRKPAHASAPVAVTAAAKAGTAASKADTFNLVGSEWQLEDLAGTGLVENVRATLAFPEAGKVSGNASCNGFFGPSQISGNEIRLGPLGGTRMACPEPAMNQETKYLNALQAAERFEWKDPYLLIYCRELDKPLRFVRSAASAIPAQQ
jgi:heat shock protein HslJ